MDAVEVPSFFLCPISLDIMRDPVTLSTGITYDRENIERWIFTGKKSTCPLTKQPLQPADCDLIIPNHTLRRLIQAWCTDNASQGVERFPTPRPPVTRAQIVDLIDEAKSKSTQSSSSLVDLLQKLKKIATESERNKRCVESSGAVDFLVSIVEKDQEATSVVLEEALNILYSLQISEQGLIQLLEKRRDFIDTLTVILQRSNYQCRAYSVLLLKSLVSVISPARLMSLRDDLFMEIVRVLKDRVSYQATKAALQVLNKISPWGRNRVTAVEAGAVSVLIELLLDEPEKKGAEMMLMVLSLLSECAEGRAEIVGHAAGIAVVAKKLVRVSVVASERAVSVMHAIAKFSPTPAVLREMLEVGVVSKLCLLIQVDCGSKTKERVKEMLSLHARVWRNSPCISPQLRSSYPSS